MYICYYETVIGNIGIIADDDYIVGLSFGLIEDNIINLETDLIKKAYLQLSEYLSGNRKVFDLPLLIDGTCFQKEVWNELLNIPYGETRCYEDVASNINNKKAVRAVGMANNKNKIPIFIPCHRVIGKSGSLVGYRGGLNIKKFLLDLESVI